MIPEVIAYNTAAWLSLCLACAALGALVGYLLARKERGE
jgi:hypothetical protein